MNMHVPSNIFLAASLFSVPVSYTCVAISSRLSPQRDKRERQEDTERGEIPQQLYCMALPCGARGLSPGPHTHGEPSPNHSPMEIYSNMWTAALNLLS